MADQTFVVTESVKAGLLDVGGHANVKAGNAAGTDYFRMPNDGKTVLVCVCGAAAKQLTFTAVNDAYGRTETLTPTPGSSKTSVIGPFLPELWNQSDGCVIFKPAAGGLVTDLYLAVRVSRPT
jgi:hypothetical protein